MSQPTRLLEERVTKLETEMADVRFLATKADREVSDVQITLRGYTGTLNALRDDQVEQGKRLARVEKKVDSVETEMRKGFTLLGQGQERITALLTRHLDEPNEETNTGGTGE